MGKNNSKLSPEDIRQLSQITEFQDGEILKWYSGFMKDCPNGKMRRTQFEEIYCNYFPDGDATKFARHVFRTFDTNVDGHIDFREFMVGLSVTKHGSQDQRLRWAFNMYDLDGNGWITHSEMLDILKAIFKMADNNVRLPRSENTPEKLCYKIFSQMDLNHDGKITLDEFLVGARECETFIRLFENPANLK